MLRILIASITLGALSMASCSIISLSGEEKTQSVIIVPERRSSQQLEDFRGATTSTTRAETESVDNFEVTSTTSGVVSTTVENIESEPGVILLLPAICEQEPTSFGRQYGTPQYDNSLLDCRGSFNYDNTISYAYVECDFNFPTNDSSDNDITKYHDINESDSDSSYSYSNSRALYSWRIFFRVDSVLSKNPSCRLYGRES